MIETKFSYTKEALTDFFSFHLKRKDKIRWIYFGIAMAFMVAGILLTFVFKKEIMGIIIIIASMIMLLLFSHRARLAASKTANSRYKRDPQKIIFTEERVEQHLETKILVYRWDLIKEVDETPKYIYFYISKVSAIIVNKDCLSEQEYKDLIELVKSKKKKYYKYSRV